MKALTLHQPWASLMAAGVKTIETRSWSTRHRGRLAIHAGKRLYTAADKHADRSLFLAAHDVLALERNGGVYDLPYGEIVATAELVDCAPMIEDGWPANETWRPALVIEGDTLSLYRSADPDDQTIIDDQLPLGDFRPGRWAWLLDDIKPTTERCPACWGDSEGWVWAPGMPRKCPACDGARTCDPIPARGRQGLWEWQP